MIIYRILSAHYMTFCAIIDIYVAIELDVQSPIVFWHKYFDVTYECDTFTAHYLAESVTGDPRWMTISGQWVGQIA